MNAKLPSFKHEDEIDHPVGKASYRFHRLMPDSFGSIYKDEGPEDDIVFIMKGHLLIEEILLEAISFKAPNSKHIYDARLSFHQCRCLIEAMYSHNLEDGWVNIWRAVNKLNSIRNKMAHNLELETNREDIEAFIRIVEKEMGVGDFSGNRLFEAIRSLHSHLLMLIDPDNLEFLKE